MDHLLSKENALLKNGVTYKRKKSLNELLSLFCLVLRNCFPRKKIDFWKLDNKMKINMFFLNRIARKKKISSETLEIQEEKPKKIINLKNKTNKKSY